MSAERKILVGQDSAGVARVLLTDASGRLLISDLSGTYCRVYNNSAISIPNATLTALTFNSERMDLTGMHSVSTNASRITALVAGIYLMGGSVNWASNANGIRQIGIYLNGASYLAAHSEMAITAGVSHNQTIGTLYELAANDYVELVAYQTSGGSLNISAAGNYSPEFWALRM